MVAAVMSLVYFVVFVLAIYYSFVIHNGPNLIAILLAFFFSPFYLVYGVFKAGVPPKRPVVQVNLKVP